MASVALISCGSWWCRQAGDGRPEEDVGADRARHRIAGKAEKGMSSIGHGSAVFRAHRDLPEPQFGAGRIQVADDMVMRPDRRPARGDDKVERRGAARTQASISPGRSRAMPDRPACRPGFDKSGKIGGVEEMIWPAPAFRPDGPARHRLTGCRYAAVARP